ncbi:MAG: hypothetical protein JNL11_07775 [Bdellovibrionaceae bacterium]|nr:hypothetical protein [Pseudobdellovibrionaceae bacterium]
MPPSFTKILVSLFICLLSLHARAGFRITGGLGLGSSSSKNEVSQSEGPLTDIFTIESVVHSRLIIGAEHLRSLNLSPMSTGISFTGIFFRNYLNSVPTPYYSADAVPYHLIVTRDLCFFTGVGIGIAQSSLLPDADGKSSNAAGFYLSPRAGSELYLTKSLGVRGELMIAMTVVGKGTVNSVSLIGSLFYSF